MRFALFVSVAGCGGPPSVDPKTSPTPSESTDPSVATTTSPTTASTPTTSTSTSSSGSSSTATSTTSSTEPVCDVPAPALFSGDCAAVDQPSIDACACGGYAALLNGQGYATIQEAADAGFSGNTIVVCPGTWTERAVDLPLDYTVQAADPTPYATVLDASVEGTALQFLFGGSLLGLTLVNATNSAVRHLSGDLLVQCGTFEDNTSGQGGAIDALYDPITVVDSTFSRNSAVYGGAIHAFSSYTASVTVDGCVFEDNRATYDGGAIAVQNYGIFSVIDSTFAYNAAGYDGGAIDTYEVEADTTIRDSTFFDNVAAAGGGAVNFGQMSGISDAAVIGSAFEGNVAATGGGVLVSALTDVSLSVEDSTFDLNSDGALVVVGTTGGFLTVTGTATLDQVTFEDNVGSALGAFGAYDVDSVAFVGTDLTVLRNDGGGGAALFLDLASIDCTTCDFGTGADDNVPADGWVNGTTYQTLDLDFSL